MIGHPSGDEPLMVDVRQSGPGSKPELPRYVMDRSMHIRISDFLEPGKSPVIT
jgi:hypothetical protein